MSCILSVLLLVTVGVISFLCLGKYGVNIKERAIFLLFFLHNHNPEVKPLIMGDSLCQALYGALSFLLIFYPLACSCELYCASIRLACTKQLEKEGIADMLERE